MPTAPPSRSSGKERDTETGLDYFGARYYGSSMGRWMSPDWSAAPVAIPYADLLDPQTLNLYAYVRNNPTWKPDIDGHGFPRKLWNKATTGHYAEGEELKTIQKAEHEKYKQAKQAWEQKHPGISYEKHLQEMGLFRLRVSLELTPMAGFSIVGEGPAGAEGVAAVASRI